LDDRLIEVSEGDQLVRTSTAWLTVTAMLHIVDRGGRWDITSRSGESPLTRAILFVPQGIALDSIYVREGMEHIARHGYELVTLVHDWDVVLQLMGLRRVDVVVFARKEHRDPDWKPRVEYVGEETQDLVRLGRHRPRNEGPSNTGDGRHRRPRLAS
jgi:hypothetical protein